MSAPVLAVRERDAILHGVRAAEAALRCASGGAILLFADRRRLAGHRLDALRDYAELRRAMLAHGHAVPPTSLRRAGFTSAQIALFDAAIMAIPADIPCRPARRSADERMRGARHGTAYQPCGAPLLAAYPVAGQPAALRKARHSVAAAATIPPTGRDLKSTGDTQDREGRTRS
jgi:hypothetical protein